MKNRTKIIGILVALIVIIGIVLTCTKGLNYDLLYDSHKVIDIPLNKQFDNKEIEEFVKEVVGNQDIVIQKVELYEDMVAISIKDISDEQLEQLNTKLNEKYETENKVEDLEVITVSKVKALDLIKPYIVPAIVSLAVIVIYLVVYTAIYTRKAIETNMVKTVLEIVGKTILAQIIYVSFIFVTRIQISNVVIPFGIVLYVITTVISMLKLEKKYNSVEK